MMNYDLFSRFGLLVVQDFFDSRLCAELRTQAGQSANMPATVWGKVARTVQANARRTKRANVSSAVESMVEEKLLLIKPRVEEHFNLALSGCETPQFLVYEEGDFFQPHRDEDPRRDSHSRDQDRLVSVIIFLNSECKTPKPDSYCGGALALYGLIRDPKHQAIGFPLSGTTGLMVAFRSDVFHEVKAVTQGKRHTIVSWYF